MLFYAWYNRFNPDDVQNSERQDYFNSNIKSFANISVLGGSHTEKFCQLAITPNSLFILSPNESINFQTSPIATTYYANSREAFYIFDSNFIADSDRSKATEVCGKNL